MRGERAQGIDASQHSACRARCDCPPVDGARTYRARLSPYADISRLFQMLWGIDKIARRDVNRVTNVCWSHLPLENLGYPYMKLNVALAAAIAALAIAGCAKKEAEAPAADAAAPAADTAAPAADAAADAAMDAAAAPADAAAAPADAAAAPADGAAAPAPAEEAPKQ
jgi:hypothetical protein